MWHSYRNKNAHVHCHFSQVDIIDSNIESSSETKNCHRMRKADNIKFHNEGKRFSRISEI